MSAAFQARFKELNGDAALVGTDTFSMDDASIASHITRIRAMDPQPDVLLLSSLLRPVLALCGSCALPA